MNHGNDAMRQGMLLEPSVRIVDCLDRLRTQAMLWTSRDTELLYITLLLVMTASIADVVTWSIPSRFVAARARRLGLVTVALWP